MIFLTPPEYRLLEYAVTPNADLARPAIADAVGVTAPSVGRMLTRLRGRGLIEIQRGPHNKFLSITPTFPFEPGKTFRTINAQKRRHH